MDNFTDIVRAITRPMIAIIFAAVIAQIVIEGIDAPVWFLTMANVVIIEWWGERIIKHVRDE